MINDNNDGPSSHVAAVNLQIQQSYYNSTLSYSEAQSQLRELGFPYLEKMPAHGSGRIAARGKGPENVSAAINWTSDGQALHWHDFTTGAGGTIFAKRLPISSSLNSVKLFYQAAERRRRVEEEVREARITTQSRAKRLARARWGAGRKNGTHPYIELKQLACLYNARLDNGSQSLLIPMWVSGQGLVNLQSISIDGKKRYLKGAKVRGAYSVIGSLNNAKRVLVCEGWATGATLFELHKLPVVVAFNACNLMAVCQELRSRFESLSVVIAADDDRQNDLNVGRQKAIQAADAVGATLLFPEFCRRCNCADHNDVLLCVRRGGRG